MPDAKLIQNAIYLPEDDLYLVSTHQHDYREHTFKDGKSIAVDGGRAYCRRAGDLFELDEAGRYVEWCLNDGEPFEGWITERLLWGSLGKDGAGPMTFRPIKHWAQQPDGLAHLKAILSSTPNIGQFHKRVVEYWIAKLEDQEKLGTIVPLNGGEV